MSCGRAGNLEILGLLNEPEGWVDGGSVFSLRQWSTRPSTRTGAHRIGNSNAVAPPIGLRGLHATLEKRGVQSPGWDGPPALGHQPRTAASALFPGCALSDRYPTGQGHAGDSFIGLLAGLPEGANPRAQDFSAEAVRIPEKAGDTVIWHGTLRHGASLNCGTRPRLVRAYPNQADDRLWV